MLLEDLFFLLLETVDQPFIDDDDEHLSHAGHHEEYGADAGGGED